MARTSREMVANLFDSDEGNPNQVASLLVLATGKVASSGKAQPGIAVLVRRHSQLLSQPALGKGWVLRFPQWSQLLPTPF